MKKIIFLLPLFLIACDARIDNTAKRKFSLVISKGTSGWTYGSSTLQCDSFKMITTKVADAWVDGTIVHIECERVIYPNSNN